MQYKWREIYRINITWNFFNFLRYLTSIPIYFICLLAKNYSHVLILYHFLKRENLITIHIPILYQWCWYYNVLLNDIANLQNDIRLLNWIYSSVPRLTFCIPDIEIAVASSAAVAVSCRHLKSPVFVFTSRLAGFWRRLGDVEETSLKQWRLEIPVNNWAA